MSETFGGFRILSRIAQGGMGETFVAERVREMGVVQRVCLKRIIAADSGDPTWIRLLKKEARTSATLRHPNIVMMHEFGRFRGQWWLSLELVEGATLRAVMDARQQSGTPMPFDTILFVAKELAKALAYLHAQRDPDGEPTPVVHRDVTPSNVLISTAGSVKLSDFGIATVMHEERTRSKNVAGKIGTCRRRS